ncbi:hypothetical protein L208DRAFT_1042948, partial [Tricholoma matsutake]
STGGGKTAAFYGPIQIYQHLLQTLVPGILTPPHHPIALIITPLIELGNNHVSLLSVKIEITDLEMDALGLKATSVNADTLGATSKEGQNLLHEISSCYWPI